MVGEGFQRRAFTVSITGISRSLMLRDRLVEWVTGERYESAPGVVTSQHEIASGKNTLHAVLARPEGEARSVLLICHGIGETVGRWHGVQQLLAAHGAASLVFNYSGYGKSSGQISSAQCERDTVAAFKHLQQLMPGMPVSMLGFSMGSGVAAAAVHQVAAKRLVLCAVFTSFRAGARCVGVPGGFSRAVPDIWNTEAALRRCPVPVLIVHGEKDALFPVRMARELAEACGENGELILVPGLKHNQPFRRPRLEYWGRILDWVSAENRERTRDDDEVFPAR
jgi:alpha-beta hydrolase superfamily lysophospholipase